MVTAIARKPSGRKSSVRNPYVRLAILRKGGPHGKTNGGLRAQRKREAKQLVAKALSQAHYLAD